MEPHEELSEEGLRVMSAWPFRGLWALGPRVGSQGGWGLRLYAPCVALPVALGLRDLVRRVALVRTCQCDPAGPSWRARTTRHPCSSWRARWANWVSHWGQCVCGTMGSIGKECVASFRSPIWRDGGKVPIMQLPLKLPWHPPVFHLAGGKGGADALKKPYLDKKPGILPPPSSIWLDGWRGGADAS